MHREYHQWHSKHLDRNMELLVFGHAGARVIAFPTSMGRFYDWEDRSMIETLGRHLENGWIQLYCVDSIDTESWYNKGVSPSQKAYRHTQYQKYIVDEVLPFSQGRNENPYVISTGASFGGYHALNIALRYPDKFNRVVSMSGLYDIGEWINGHYDDAIHQSHPIELARRMHDCPEHLEKVKQLDIIIPIGKEDPNYWSAESLSGVLWQNGIWHALRPWDGNAHDWGYWRDMLLNYVGGVDSKG